MARTAMPRQKEKEKKRKDRIPANGVSRSHPRPGSGPQVSEEAGEGRSELEIFCHLSLPLNHSLPCYPSF